MRLPALRPMQDGGGWHPTGPNRSTTTTVGPQRC